MPGILFVDDNKNVREFCKRELGREGYRVILCEDGNKALQILRKEPPDLVIMDVHMPLLNGIETARLMRAQIPHLPIIFYTVHQEALDGGPAGMAEVQVEKSEDLTELKSQVAQVLAWRSHRKEKEVQR